MGVNDNEVMKATKNVVNAAIGNGKEPSRTGVCPDCKGIVSKLASVCPHCGRPLTEEEIEMNPADKPWYKRTAEDEKIIAKAQGKTPQKGGGAGVLGIMFAIILAVILLIVILPKLTGKDVQGALKQIMNK